VPHPTGAWCATAILLAAACQQRRHWRRALARERLAHLTDQFCASQEARGLAARLAVAEADAVIYRAADAREE